MTLLRLPHLALLVLALVALAVAGCGGEEESEPADAGGGGGPVATLDVVETDFEIDPAEAEVAESGPIEINLSNEGQTTHSLEIEAPEEEIVSDTIAAGESTTFTADLPQGEFTWYCPIANHRELGMEGSITVGGGGSGAGDSGGSDSGDEGSGSGGSPSY